MKLFFLINIFLYSFLSFANNYKINKPYVSVYCIFPYKNQYSNYYEDLAPYEKAVTVIKGNTCIKQMDQYLYNDSVTRNTDFDEEGLVFVEKNESSMGYIKLEDWEISRPLSYAKYSPHKTSVMIISPFFEYEGVKYSMGTVLCIDREIIKNNPDNLGELNHIKALSLNNKREQIISLAKKLIGQPYQWGGRTALDGGGYDCAGLVNIVYLASGLDTPRGVGMQYQKSTDINSSNDLLIGDLLFYCDITKFDSAIHVMLYTGKKQGKHTYIHATPEAMSVVEETYDVDEIINNTLIPGTNYKLKLRRLNVWSVDSQGNLIH